MAEGPSEHLVEPSVLTRLMAQPLLARHPMEGSMSGQHRSPHRGSSVEFAEYRNYVPGDDIRRLDWRVFARTDRFYLKEFEAETNLRCYLVVDCSASMGFAAAHGRKLDYARRLAATLAYLTVHQGDAVALWEAGAKVGREIPPRRNPAHLQLLFNTLKGMEAKGRTGLVEALHALAEKAGRRALVVIFSDCFCEIEALVSAFRHLRFQKHDLAVFHLLDRLELDFSLDRPVRFVDLEGAGSVVTEPALVREAYRRGLRQYLERLRLSCHEFQADYRQVVTDRSYEQVLADFLVDRARFAAVGR